MSSLKLFLKSILASIFQVNFTVDEIRDIMDKKNNIRYTKATTFLRTIHGEVCLPLDET